MKIKFLIVTIFCCCIQNAIADSPVWKVSKGEEHLYLGGTIHLLGESDYPLPSGFNQAYRDAEKIVFETNIQKIKSVEFAQILMGHAMYPPGKDLKKILKPKTFQALKNHFESRGMPIDAMLNFKIGMVIVSLSTIELQRLGVAGTGVDEFFNNKALADKKRMDYLETPAQQVIFIAEMGTGMEDKIVEHTLRDLKELPNLLKSLKFSWRTGDNKRLNEIVIAPFKQDYPEVYKALLVKRNNNWIPHIETMLRTSEVELVLVGALHLVGEDGILKQLAERGYQIEKL